MLEENELESIDEVQFLGVVLDANLNFSIPCIEYCTNTNKVNIKYISSSKILSFIGHCELLLTTYNYDSISLPSY